MNFFEYEKENNRILQKININTLKEIIEKEQTLLIPQTVSKKKNKK
jgi:hypothetical protein